PAFKGEGDNAFHWAADDINPNWRNRDDIELLSFHKWTMSRLPIDAIDPKEKLIRLRGRTAHPMFALEKDARYLVENVAEALHAPGEWYLDRASGKLRYIAAAGEN